MNLDNYIRLCKCDDYKRYMWIEINLCKENLYIVACYIPHEESTTIVYLGWNVMILSRTYLKTYLFFEELGKVLNMGDFNVRIGKYQNMEIA